MYQLEAPNQKPTKLEARHVLRAQHALGTREESCLTSSFSGGSLAFCSAVDEILAAYASTAVLEAGLKGRDQS